MAELDSITIKFDLLNEEPFVTTLQCAEILCQAAEGVIADMERYGEACHRDLEVAVRAFREQFAEPAEAPQTTTSTETTDAD